VTTSLKVWFHIFILFNPLKTCVHIHEHMENTPRNSCYILLLLTRQGFLFLIWCLKCVRSS